MFEGEIALKVNMLEGLHDYAGKEMQYHWAWGLAVIRIEISQGRLQ